VDTVTPDLQVIHPAAEPTGTDLLIAEDDKVSRRALEMTLQKWGHRVCVTDDGTAAWEALQRPDLPTLAILDWTMPGLDGIQLCRRIRETPRTKGVYVILLTARHGKEAILEGLDSGADDFITKPFDRDELRARLNVGLRVASLQQSLAARVGELEQALQNVKNLQGLLPICCYCKKIRDDGNYWQRVEEYISQHSEARFSHGICPDCFDQIVKKELQATK
jgi:sigma-B regulation protein RsbU (phosphoserine phosphatase)